MSGAQLPGAAGLPAAGCCLGAAGCCRVCMLPRVSARTSLTAVVGAGRGAGSVPRGLSGCQVLPGTGYCPGCRGGAGAVPGRCAGAVPS